MCKTCGLHWTGRREAHCSSCCRHFSAVTGFDWHQRQDDQGRVTCLDPATALNKRGEPRLVCVNGTWKQPGQPPTASQRAA